MTEKFIQRARLAEILSQIDPLVRAEGRLYYRLVIGAPQFQAIIAALREHPDVLIDITPADIELRDDMQPEDVQRAVDLKAAEVKKRFQ